MNNIPSWLLIARKYTGVKELKGDADNPVILNWAKRIGGWVASFYKKDATPWCGLFVASVLREAGITELPKNPLRALEWASYGRRLNGPRPGCICVFMRKGGGHVAFYEGEDLTHIHVRGGNQGDAVNVMRIARERLVPGGMRWPKDQNLPPPNPIFLNSTDADASDNEA